MAHYRRHINYISSNIKDKSKGSIFYHIICSRIIIIYSYNNTYQKLHQHETYVFQITEYIKIKYIYPNTHASMH